MGGWFAGPSQYLPPARTAAIEDNTKTRLYQAATKAQHIWIAVVAYYVNPAPEGDSSLVLDIDNLMGRPSIGCFFCEEKWSAELAGQPCSGDPDYPVAAD